MQNFYRRFIPDRLYEGFMNFATVEFNTVNFCKDSEIKSWQEKSNNQTWMQFEVNVTDTLTSIPDDMREWFTAEFEDE